MSAPTQRSLPDVLQDIVANLQEIIRSEFRLATTEVKEKSSRAVAPAITLGTGLVFGIYALGFVLLAGLFALHLVLELWLSALIVGVVVGVTAIALISSGKAKLSAVNAAPEKTIESVKEDVRWVKNQIK